MTVHLWRIAADTANYTADDMTGEGARRTGGRWNRKDEAVVYSATSIALACLETIVHLGAASLPLNRYLVRLDVPDEVWARAKMLPATKAPVGWDAIPAGKVSLDVGKAWLTGIDSPVLLCVPSVIVPEELNVMVNPAHKESGSIKVAKVRKWTYDARVWSA